MKKILFFSVAMLCLLKMVNGQTEIITYPTEGSVFQANSFGVFQIAFGGQVKNTNPMFYRIEKRNGANSWQVIVNDASLSTNFSVLTGGIGRGLFSTTYNSNLSKGWYRLSIYRKWNNWFGLNTVRSIKHQVQFGVGDIYFIAGQSNASGWYWNDTFSGLDNAISTTGESDKSSPMSRTITYQNDNTGQGQNEGVLLPITKGIPYNNSQSDLSINFSELKISPIAASASAQNGNRINIYPNGYDSWAYGPLGYKMATNEIDGGDKYAGTPSLWFNAAVGGTSINQGIGFTSWLDNPFSSSSLIGKLDYTLLNFAGPFGAKGVLWHQGEYDHLVYLNGLKSATYTNDYSVGLSQIIEWTRQAVDNSMKESSKLNWFISDVSYLPYSSSPVNSSNSVSSSINTLPSGYIGLTPGAQSHWTSSNLIATGQTITRNRPISPSNVATNSVYYVPAGTPHRILKINEQEESLTFKYKDYRHRGTDAEQKEMSISIDEFIRRFEQHILPFRYVRIRNFGYLQNHGRAKRLKGLFEKLKLPAPPDKMRIPIYVTIREKYGVDIRVCPKCKEHHLELVATHYRSGTVLMKDKPKNKASPTDF
jgi:hypothetical protein